MITDAQKWEFEVNGYLRIPGVLTEGDFVAVREEFSELLSERAREWKLPQNRDVSAGMRFEDRLLSLAGQPGFNSELLGELDITLPHAPFSSIQPDSLFHVGPGLLSLVSNAKVLDVVEAFVGSEIMASGNQHCRLKLPDAMSTADHVGRSAANAAAQTPWHTDAMTQVDASAATTILTVWIPLGNVGPEDGCLTVVPGGHLQRDSVPWPLTQSMIGELNDKSVLVPAEYGDIVLLHKELPHASAPNTSSRVRWSFDLRYYPSSETGDRPWFPSIIVRSGSSPESLMSSGERWKSLWEDTRRGLSESGQPLPGRADYARAVAETYVRRWAEGKFFHAPHE